MKLKKILAGALAFAAAVACMPITKSYAYASEWVDGDFAYRIPNLYIPEGSSFDELDVEIIKYLGDDGNVVIPTKVGKHKVVGISGRGRTDLIDDIYQGGAFQDRTDITSITIPEGVEYINTMAFWNCTSLTSVTIPSTVESIAFGGQHIYQDNVFKGCTSLTSINVDEKNETYCSVDGILCDKDMATLLLYPYGRKESTYRIPDNIKSVSQAAFIDNQYIDTIIVPASVKYLPLTFGGYNDGLDENGFTSFGNIIVEEDNKFFCSIDGVLFNKKNSDDQYYDLWTDHICLLSYPNRKRDDTYIIPNNVDVIFPNAFNSCDYLKTLVLPSTAKAHIYEWIYSPFHSYYTSLSSLIIFQGDYTFGADFLRTLKDNNNITIYGIPGSKTEENAKENNITFIPLTTLKDDNTDVDITGDLPKGVSLKVEKTASEETYIGYDITIIDSEGKVTQPDCAIEASLPMPEGFTAEDCIVYRKESDGTYTDMKAVYRDGYMIFTTNHFSEYILSTKPFEGGESGDITTSPTETTVSSTAENNPPSNTAADTSISDQSVNTTIKDPESTSKNDDNNVNTGIVLCIVPSIIAAAGVIIAKKRK